jgi:hypothetical protein
MSDGTFDPLWFIVHESGIEDLSLISVISHEQCILRIGPEGKGLPPTTLAVFTSRELTEQFLAATGRRQLEAFPIDYPREFVWFLRRAVKRGWTRVAFDPSPGRQCVTVSASSLVRDKWGQTAYPVGRFQVGDDIGPLGGPSPPAPHQ